MSRPASASIKASPAASARPSAPVGSDRELLHDLSKMRIGGHGWRAVHLLSSYLSERRTFREDQATANSMILATVAMGGSHRLYNLSNGDIVFLYSQLATQAVVSLCTALETSIFEGASSAKNLYDEYGHYKIFDLSRDIASLIHGVREALVSEIKVIAKPPISPKHAVIISEKLRGTNIRSLVFNQPVFNLRHPKPSIEFLEFYTSIGELEKLFAPERSIAGNPWLFNLIKRELDMALIRSIHREIGEYRHKAFSVNLLVESFMADGFRVFLDGLPVKLGGKIFAELEKSDLIQHSHLLPDLFKRAKALDVPICIDGLSHHDLSLIKLSNLKCSFFKLKWDGEIMAKNADEMALLVQELKKLDSQIILTRCDTPKALSFAKALGIHYVQGRLADEYFRQGAIEG